MSVPQGSVRGRRGSAFAWIVKSAVAVAVLAWLATGVNLGRFFASMAGASLPLLAVSLAVFLADDLLVAHKWRRLLHGAGIATGLWTLFQVYMKGKFIAFFIPSSVTSDVYKGAALTREHGSGKAVVSSIVLERLLGLVSIATISVVAAGALPARILGFGSGTAVAIAATVAAGGLAAFLSADRIAGAALRCFPVGWQRLRTFLVDMAAAFSVYRGQRALLAETFALSLLIQVSRSLAVWILARAVDDTTSFLYFLLLVPYVFLVNLLPVASSRIGLEQGVFVVLFAAVGMQPETALAVSLLSVAVGLVAALPGGAWLLAER